MAAHSTYIEESAEVSHINLILLVLFTDCSSLQMTAALDSCDWNHLQAV